MYKLMVSVEPFSFTQVHIVYKIIIFNIHAFFSLSTVSSKHGFVLFVYPFFAIDFPPDSLVLFILLLALIYSSFIDTVISLLLHSEVIAFSW